jgi:hypothetical protein
VIALVFCVFLVWLWLYSPGSTDDTTAPSFASAEVRDWMDNNELQELKKDPKFIGKRREKQTKIRFSDKLGIADLSSGGASMFCM